MIIYIDDHEAWKNVIQWILSSYMIFSIKSKVTMEFLNNIIEQLAITMLKLNVEIFL